MKRLIFISGFVTVLLSAMGPAMADIELTYDLQEAFLDYVAGTQTLTVGETADSTFVLKKVDGLTTLDGAKLSAPADTFDVALVLSLIDLVGVDNWGGSGTLKFTDKNAGYVAVADVAISNAWIANDDLYIQGFLSSSGANSSILRPDGDPWRFKGTTHVGLADQDGVAGQITVANPASFDNGDVLTLRFGVGNITLDSLFGSSFQTDGGELKGSIVPTPGAVVLGALGLGLIGWARRRVA